MRIVPLLALAGAAVVVGCGDSDDELAAGRQPDERYAVLSSADWSLREARDLASDSPFATVEQPPVDWYAEYLSASDPSAMVRLSGHAATLDETRAELEAVGFTFDDVEIGGRAAADARPDEPTNPSLVLLDSGATTFMVLSYELDPEELAAVADDIGPASQDAWIDAGGVVD